MKQLTLAVVLLAGAAFAQASPRAETAPIPSGPTAANDTAIWIHPTDPNRSLVFGTDQVSGGLYSYGLDGTLRQQVNLGLTVAVDVRYGVLLSGGVTTDVVLMANADGVFRLLAPDRDAGFLTLVDSSPTVTGSNTSAASFYYSPTTRELVVYIADTTGRLRQYAVDSNQGKFTTRLARTVTLGAQVDGIASDDRRERLFITVANRGLFTLQAPVDGIITPSIVESIDAGRLGGAAGVAIYYTADGGGYVIVSASQTSRYPVYSLDTGAFMSSFTLATSDGGIRGPTNSRGIDVLNLPMGATFSKGLFVAHDPNNPTTGPNYKLIGWEDIARPPLTVDTRFDIRTQSVTSADAGRPDAGRPDAGTKCVTPMVDAGTDAGVADAGPGVDGGDAGLDPDAGPTDGGSDAGPVADAGVDAGCISGTGGGGGNSGVGGGFPPIGGGGGFEEPKGCGCGQAGLLIPLAALAWLLRRRRETAPPRS